MNEFTLIEGVFTPEEAKEVLLNLIEYKIQFHHRKNFSSEIKSGQQDEHSLRRMEELKKTKQKIQEMLNSKDNEDVHLSITSLITINTLV